ncbi:MAG: hypothetical protein N4A72_20975 [Bacteroidales bacterium]|nr:hypothetical protein [Bacteroidales bacterium]
MIRIRVTRFAYIILILITISSCRKKTALQEMDLKSINTTIKIPWEYKIEKEGIIREYINQNTDEVLRNKMSSFTEGIFLVDTVNPARFINVSEIKPYVEIDSMVYWSLIGNQRSTSCTEPKPDSTYYFGSRMRFCKDFKYIESKYIKHINDCEEPIIAYSFIISMNNRTIGVCFFGPGEQYVLNYINSIKIN